MFAVQEVYILSFNSDLINPISFYCTPFEKQLALYVSTELLKEGTLHPSEVKDILTKVKDLFLNEITLPILNRERFYLSKEELAKEDGEKLIDLVIYEDQKVKNLFNDTNCNISVNVIIDGKQECSDELQSISQNYKSLLLYKIMNSTIAPDLLTTTNISEIMSFLDSIILYFTIGCLRESFKNEINLHNLYSLEYSDIFLGINFLSLLFNSDQNLIECISQLKSEKPIKVTIEGLRFQNYYIISNKHFGSLAKSLCKIGYSQLNHFGFGFAKKLKVCNSCHRGHIIDMDNGRHEHLMHINNKKCQCGFSNFTLYKNIFLISEGCYEMLKDHEKLGITFERYVYLSVRKLFATKQLNFIISRNIAINQNEFDIICIPVGSLFRKMLIIECKTVCEDSDINAFNHKISNTINNEISSIYPTIVYLKNKVSSNIGKIYLYSIYQIEKLIEDYIKDSFQF